MAGTAFFQLVIKPGAMAACTAQVNFIPAYIVICMTGDAAFFLGQAALVCVVACAALLVGNNLMLWMAPAGSRIFKVVAGYTRDRIARVFLVVFCKAWLVSRTVACPTRAHQR